MCRPVVPFVFPGLLILAGCTPAVQTTSTVLPNSTTNASVSAHVVTKTLASKHKPSVLSETTERKIYDALLAAHERAFKEADQKIHVPDNSEIGKYSDAETKQRFEKHDMLSKQLNAKYEGNILTKFHISKQQLNDILPKGFKAGWPGTGLAVGLEKRIYATYQHDLKEVDRQAEAKYPRPSDGTIIASLERDRLHFENKLAETFEHRLENQQHITHKQLDNIESKGIANHWSDEYP